jgi:hypothetical protein
MRFLTFIESFRPPASRYGMPIYGDWPFVPEGLRRAAETMPGGGAVNAARAQGSHCHSHHDGSGF